MIGARRCYPSSGLGPDVAALKQYYQNNGFYDTTVDTVVTKASSTAVDITFRINEGAPIRLDTLRIEGLELVKDTASILKKLELRVAVDLGATYWRPTATRSSIDCGTRDIRALMHCVRGR